MRRYIMASGALFGLLAMQRQLISAEEYALWQKKETLRRSVIKVDDFPQDFGRAELAEEAESRKPQTARAA